MRFGKKTFNISCADGKALFATDHPSITGGTAAQYNLYNAEFSYDNLSYAEEKMHYFKDDDGRILTCTPDTIIIPDKAEIKKKVFEAVGSDGNPTTANRAANIHLGRWNVVFSPYLERLSGATGDCWMLLDSTFNEAYEALVWLDRIPLTVRSVIDDADNNVFKGRARYAAAPNNWRAIICCAPGLSGASSF
jgi:phage major head subunit gpT-like protein